MRRLIVSGVALILRLVLKLRYKIEVRGFDSIKKECKKKGVLFLPNHPAAIIDPLVTGLTILPSFLLSPLVIEYMYYHWLAYPILRFLNAYPVPDSSMGFTSTKAKRVEKILDKVVQGLSSGENFLIYPSGTTKLTAQERLGGAFSVHEILERSPDTQVVLVRLTGLWGSSFSRALTHGKLPHIKESCINAFWSILKNIFFFVPKRKLLLEFELAPKEFFEEHTKMGRNKWLEGWYNKPFFNEITKKNPGEPLYLVSYAFWKEQLLPFAPKPQEESEDIAIPEEVEKAVLEELSLLAEIPQEKIRREHDLIMDLGLDSLNMAELITFLDERFSIQDVLPQSIPTVFSVLRIASGYHVETEIAHDPLWDIKGWEKRKKDDHLIEMIVGNSLPEAFLRMAEKDKNAIMCMDPVSGPRSGIQLKRAVLLLSKKLQKVPEERIGILLPSSIGVQVIILACHMANKTPVMINWTVGGSHLATAQEISGIGTVISSWKFLDVMRDVDLSSIEDKIIFIEEVRAKLGLFSRIQAFFEAMRSTSSLLQKKAYRHLLDPNVGEKEAVILFTSGTESAPKGVPLTHTNILSDQNACIQAMRFQKNDSLLAILPPFHSFGFSISGLLPLVGGIPVAYYPDPLDAVRLLQAMRTWEISVLCAAPSFLRAIFSRNKEPLPSIRTIVSGAEKAQDTLIDLCIHSCPNARFVEGYGITECAPALTINVDGNRDHGVGKALSIVSMKVIYVDEPTKECPIGIEGLIIVRGPNVFKGYLGSIQDPFILFEGSLWYNTGDLGRLDAAGNLTISGRLKRFVKIGGEMISLAAIEKVFEKDGQVAVCAEETDSVRPYFVLFTTKNVTQEEVNNDLRVSGFSNLVRIRKVVVLPELPLTGTGKVAYRELEKMF